MAVVLKQKYMLFCHVSGVVHIEATNNYFCHNDECSASSSNREIPFFMITTSWTRTEMEKKCHDVHVVQVVLKSNYLFLS